MQSNSLCVSPKMHELKSHIENLKTHFVIHEEMKYTKPPGSHDGHFSDFENSLKQLFVKFENSCPLKMTLMRVVRLKRCYSLIQCLEKTLITGFLICFLHICMFMTEKVKAVGQDAI